jgi:hypothetical protein
MEEKLVDQAPRNVLERLVAEAAKEGLRVKTGVEPEFFILNADGSGPYSYDPLTEEFTLVAFGATLDGDVTVDNSGVETRLDAISDQIPATLGTKAAADSLSVAPATGALTNASDDITPGGTAQQLVASNAARRGLTMQNTSAGDLRVSPWGTASVTAGYQVGPGQLLVLDTPHCGVGAVSVWGSTTGQTFIAAEAV